MPGHTSEEEFNAVYREWYPRLLARASMVCGAQRALASDAVQEAFTRCWLRMNDPDSTPVRNWGAWLAKTVLRQAIDLRDRHSSTAPLDDFEQLERGPELAELMDVKESFVQVCTAIASLPARQCEVVALYYLAGLSYAEIADMLRIEESTVRKHRSDASKKLEPLAVRLKQQGLLDREGGDQQ
ncbi:RNA polymerase sigma factor [Streptomyces sp. NPDC088810]|uniref:RNA polymerase sigma factor n=1 Tax=Streptomyces sp. NPDC088810 TaxID=3365904 RepID=UPI003817C387